MSRAADIVSKAIDEIKCSIQQRDRPILQKVENIDLRRLHFDPAALHSGSQPKKKKERREKS